MAQEVSAMLVAGCHAIDALRWFAAPGKFEAATPVEVFAMRGGYRKGSSHEYNPLANAWRDVAPPMEYDGLEVALVKFNNGVLGKVSVNADCIMPYRFKPANYWAQASRQSGVHEHLTVSTMARMFSSGVPG